MKIGVIITNAFQKILERTNRKPNKIWVEFYNRSVKSQFPDKDIELYLTHNKGRSVDDEIFITILKNKIYKYLISISKYLYIDKLNGIVYKHNNIYHTTIKMKPVGVK